MSLWLNLRVRRWFLPCTLPRSAQKANTHLRNTIEASIREGIKPVVVVEQASAPVYVLRPLRIKELSLRHYTTSWEYTWCAPQGPERDAVLPPDM
jgi:hypothetical protein